MGQSMASSVISSQSKTFSSVTEVLQMCADDAEETLYQLGFGCEEPQVTARIPARFFNFPSKLKGINFRLFLESQLQRIREEDPNLSLASRFRQVEVLTAMANAFYSLYSHVSRTPVQKLAPPEFSFSSPTVERSIGQRFFSTVRNEPRSPVERLKDTVSKMCLYTGSRGSESGSPSCSPRKRNSLPDVVEIVMGNVRGEGSHDRRRGALLQDQAGAISTAQRTEDVKMPLLSELKPAEKVSEHENINDAHKKRIQRWSQSGQRESPRAKACLFRFEQAAVESMQSHKSKCDTDGDKGFNDSSSSTGAKTPVIHDASCPQVIDFVHQTPCSCPQRVSMATLGTPPATQIQQIDSSLRTFECNQETVIPDTQPEICLLPVSQDEFSEKLPLTLKISQHNLVTQGSTCQITVTGWEDDAPVSHRDFVEDFMQPMYSDSTAHQQLLSPVKSSSSQINDVPKQANSFELEEK
ncbi:protein ITPRID2 [Trichomycterus rosablanca]|uniref:protein ITPRID2 n=1 Tax=Trichomycterus rosablanca TaxID=2290929 RepID=UPI002F352D7C